ncbi:hypothetical protein FNO01nite_16140 [Flavobacterium noncentrifugens]|nr:hypothetical protein FNO01nite_16140 [Flavobacterium noncentrifugens]
MLALLFVGIVGFGQEKFEESKVKRFQDELNTEFASKDKSPLTEENRKDFKTLDFFSSNAKYFVVADFKRTESEKPFKMKTSTDRTPVYVKFGELTFTLEGKLFRLNVYQNIELLKKKGFEDYLFLPFSDLTSGKETYIGGRYIDMKIPKGNQVAIDFNTAYNPYCAYNHKYSCPIVPLENDLNIEINAGVKKFHD